MGLPGVKFIYHEIRWKYRLPHEFDYGDRGEWGHNSLLT